VVDDRGHPVGDRPAGRTRDQREQQRQRGAHSSPSSGAAPSMGSPPSAISSPGPPRVTPPGPCGARVALFSIAVSLASSMSTLAPVLWLATYES
ncbi:MAG: hypothetical protein ACK56I_28235, partial [bacterium]